MHARAMSDTAPSPALHTPNQARPSPLVVEPADLASLSAESWDRLLEPGRRLLCRAFLEAAGTVELDGFELGALVARSDGRIVSAAPAYPYRLDLTLFAGGVAQRLTSALRHLVPSLLKVSVFEVGWPSTVIEPLIGAKDPAILRAMAETALAQAARHGADLLVFRDFGAGDDVPAAALGPLGFEAVPLPTDFELSISRFESYEGYVAALRSSYRQKLRRLSKGKPVTFERVHDFSPLTREMVVLSRSVHERAKELHRESLGEAFFSKLARVPGASALLMRDGAGTVTRFAVLHDDRPTLRPLFYGGPPVADHDLSYVRMLNQFIRIGIDERFSTIGLGVTTGEPKLEAGAEARRLCAWVRHRSPFAQRAIVSLMRGPLAPLAPSPRHVFKDAVDQRGPRQSSE